MRHFTFTISALSLLLAWTAPLVSAKANPPSTVALLRGDILHGECVTIEGGIMARETAYGAPLHIPLSDIRSLDLGGLWDLEFNDGQRMRTQWTITEGKITVPSSVFGDLRCAPDQLKSAVRAISARGVGDSGTSSPPAIATSANSPSSAAAAAPPTTNQAPPSSLQTMLRESPVLLRPGEWNVSTRPATLIGASIDGSIAGTESAPATTPS